MSNEFRAKIIVASFEKAFWCNYLSEKGKGGVSRETFNEGGRNSVSRETVRCRK